MNQSTRMKPAFLTLALLAAAAPGFAAKNETSHNYKSTLSGTSVRKVIFEVPIAQLEVVAVKSADLRIEGTARREFSGEDERAVSQRMVDAASLVFVRKGKNIHVERRFVGDPGWRQRNSIKFKVTLFVPEGLDVEIDQRIGDITLTGNLGDVKLELNVGRVSVDMPKSQVAELIASSRIGEVTTNLPDRTVLKQGVFAGATQFLNDNGKSVVRLKVNVGEVVIDLK